ncbi:hypothetical protein [Embleya hyalina]|uniref:hypothetical protein n=1 Tax=Embleya hyalina TaxID=516124 RepID=UPI001FE540C9|nr:hypothetical protein [Embleya hyalina]
MGSLVVLAGTGDLADRIVPWSTSWIGPSSGSLASMQAANASSSASVDSCGIERPVRARRSAPTSRASVWVRRVSASAVVRTAAKPASRSAASTAASVGRRAVSIASRAGNRSKNQPRGWVGVPGRATSAGER